MWWLPHQWSFLLFWLFLIIGTLGTLLLVHQQFWLFLTIGTVCQSSKQQNDHWCTNRYMCTKTVPTVYQSSKDSQNSNKMTIGVPIVKCLHRIRRIHKVHVRVCWIHERYAPTYTDSESHNKVKYAWMLCIFTHVSLCEAVEGNLLLPNFRSASVLIEVSLWKGFCLSDDIDNRQCWRLKPIIPL